MITGTEVNPRIIRGFGWRSKSADTDLPCRVPSLALRAEEFARGPAPFPIDTACLRTPSRVPWCRAGLCSLIGVEGLAAGRPADAGSGAFFSREALNPPTTERQAGGLRARTKIEVARSA